MEKAIILAALAAVTAMSGSAQATITVYTTQASYLAAISAPGTDTFESLSISGLTASPINRTTSFRGFVSTTGITGFTINTPTVDTVNGPFYFPTSNNLILGGALAGAVPEPASWAMMTLGIGLTGATLRRRRLARVVAA